MTDTTKGRTRTRKPENVAREDQILKMLQEAAPLPMSTSAICDALPSTTGYWKKPHHQCPTCKCEPEWHPYWYGARRVPNHEVYPLLTRLVRVGLVEKWKLDGQNSCHWLWIGESS